MRVAIRREFRRPRGDDAGDGKDPMLARERGRDLKRDTNRLSTAKLMGENGELPFIEPEKQNARMSSNRGGGDLNKRPYDKRGLIKVGTRRGFGTSGAEEVRSLHVKLFSNET